MNQLERGTAAWDRAWAQVSEACVACGMSPDLGAGEGWQYMGSDEGSHTFRNRLLRTAVGDRRVYIHVPTNGAASRVIVQPEPSPEPVGVWRAHPGSGAALASDRAASARKPVEGVDWQCTGNFDGFSCGSDADSGL